MASNNVVPLNAGGQIAAIVPTNINEVYRLATAISQSGLAPNGMKSPEQITIAIMHGMEIGLPPMQAVQRIAVVNGRPTIWGDAIPALLLSRGFRLKETMEGEGDKRLARCEIKRPDGTSTVGTFGVDDAKTAGLWGKQGPWKQYPDRMLKMRARGFAARDGAADVLSGLYLREEIDDEPMRDITPAKASTALLDIPDIPEEPEPDESADSQEAVLRELQDKLEAEPARAAEIERDYGSAIMAMDADGREAAIEMIQAAKEAAE